MLYSGILRENILRNRSGPVENILGREGEGKILKVFSLQFVTSGNTNTQVTLLKNTASLICTYFIGVGYLYRNSLSL